MEIVQVTEENLREAAFVHGAAWRVSHEKICSASFIAAHTTQHQMDYIRNAIRLGRRFYLLKESITIAVIAIEGDIISDLFVHPAEQRKGYGTALLRYAISQCDDNPKLWVLNTNPCTRKLYPKIGFIETGLTKALSENLFEIEMKYQKGCSV